MSIARYMVDQIAVGVFVDSDNRHRKPVYATTVITNARIEEKISTVRSADGTLRKVNTVITTMMPIGYRDRVWMAPFASNNSRRLFPEDFEFVDADAKTPVLVANARKMRGNGGHFEVWF